MSYMGRCLKRMKKVIALAKKGNFAFMSIVSGKISLEVFGGSAGYDVFKKFIEFELLRCL
jgi:hypothetical protein